MLAAKVPATLLKQVDCFAGDNRSAWIRIAIQEKIDREGRASLKFKPKTELGRRLLALRNKHFAEGGKSFTLDEVREEVVLRRGRLA